MHMNTIERAAKEACYAFAIVLFSVLLIGHLLYKAARPGARTPNRVAPKPADGMVPLYMNTWVPSLTAWAQSPRKEREQPAGE